jgi:glutamate-5-semialdehyde dehydrogenase
MTKFKPGLGVSNAGTADASSLGTLMTASAGSSASKSPSRKMVEMAAAEWLEAPQLLKIKLLPVFKQKPAAIAWINGHSSGHADCIATDSYQESQQFSMGVDSALVYVNSPPHFYRNPRQGESLFLGVSNQKGQRRGLVGLEAFMTPKQVIQG